MRRRYLYPAALDEGVQIGGREPEQAAYLEIRDAPLGNQTPHVTLVDIQILGRFAQGEWPSSSRDGRV
jgi:hypothetical protein